jgi:thiol-disulfide isomerase/thioredoxin
MTITPLASLVVAVSLASFPAAASAQDTKAPAPAATGLDDATATKARQAYQKVMNEVFAAIDGGRNADRAKIEEALAPKRAAICTEFALDPATMNVAQIEMLSPVLTPELAKAADARLDSLSANPDAEGFAAAMALAARSDDADAYAALMSHDGLDAFVQANGLMALTRALASVNPERLRPAANDLVALGSRYRPTPEGTMGIAGYMKMIVDLGDAVDAETRETLRLELLAKSKDALASAEKIDDDAKRKEAVDRLKRSLTKLDAGPMKGPIIDKPAPEVTLEWVHDANGPVTLADLDSLKGKIVILDFWATWCGPCVASFPKIRELRAHYPGDDVVILGVTSLQGKHYPRGASPIDCAGDPAKERQLMTEYMKVMEITWPIAFSAQDVFNADYDVSGIPHVAIIDAKGVLRHNNLHPASPLDEKTKLIDALLVEAGKTPPAKPQPQP